MGVSSLEGEFAQPKENCWRSVVNGTHDGPEYASSRRSAALMPNCRGLKRNWKFRCRACQMKRFGTCRAAQMGTRPVIELYPITLGSTSRIPGA